MPKQRGNFVGYVFLSVFGLGLLGALAVGLYLSIWGTWETVNGLASRAWPSVEGTVTSADLHPADPESAAGGPFWLVTIVYAYEVDGKPFRGERQRYDCGDSYCGDRGDVDRYLEKYPMGGRTAIRYDPLHPERSVLEPGLQRPALLMLAGGLVFILGSSTMTWIVLRTFAKLRKDDKQQIPDMGMK